MLIGKFVKKKPSYLLIVLLLISFSCTSGSVETSEQDKSEQSFDIPKLVQQEILAEDSSDLEEYGFYNISMEKGPVIPGIFQGAVPQGMIYYHDEDLMLVSNYMFDSRPGCITAISMADGLLKKTLWLLNPDGNVNHGWLAGWFYPGT